MPLPGGVGTNSVTLGTAGTKRDDISNQLLRVLVLANNVMGALKIGPEFADSILQFDEDSLNSNQVTDATSGGINSTATSMTFSATDASNLPEGSVIADVASPGIGGGEHLQVVAVNPVSGVVTVVRGFSNTTAATHAQSAIFQIISRPDKEGSDIGQDYSKARIRKLNYIHRQTVDVVLTAEAILRARAGYTPGISDELEYQFRLRTEEILRIWNTAFLYSRGQAGRNGQTNISGGDYSTMWGIRSMLDGGWNSTAAPTSWTTKGYANGDVFNAVNDANLALYRNGSRAELLISGPLGAHAVGRLFADRIRIGQDDRSRGYFAQHVRTLLGNELQLIADGVCVDTAGIAELYLLDSQRFRIRPFIESMYYTITAPVLRDGDQVRAISKLSLEGRNTGTDVGAASLLVQSGTLGT